MTQHEMMLAMEARGCKPRVIERVLKLNPNGCDDFARPRGWHRKCDRGWRLLRGFATKGEFIARHGRAAWGALPRSALIADGRRRMVSRVAIADSLWLLAPDHPERREPMVRL